MAQPKILIVRSDRLGDLVLSSGYLAALVEHFSGHEVHLWLAPDALSTSQVLHPALTVRALPFDRHLTCGPDPAREWIQEIRQTGYEFAVVPQFTLGYPEILALGWSGIPVVWGFLNRALHANPAWIERDLGAPPLPPEEWIRHGVTPDPWIHEVDKYRLLAEAQGIRGDLCEPRLFGIDAPADKGGLLLWPGSGDEYRRWPAVRFAEVVRGRGEKEVTIGATESDLGPAEELRAELGAVGIDAAISLRDPGGLRETAGWLAGFRLLIANDTGIAHLASAVGVPVAAVSGSQHRGRFSVRGRDSLTVFADVPCERCDGRCHFETAPYPCLSSIQATDIDRLLRGQVRGELLMAAGEELRNPETLFPLLAESRRVREEKAEREALETNAGFRRLQAQLQSSNLELASALLAVRDAENLRSQWEVRFQQTAARLEATQECLASAEAQAMEWRAACARAESARGVWEDLCHKAEAQRDEWRHLCEEAEGQRNQWRTLCGEAESQRDDWRTVCGEAESQRDAWTALCHEAERQRDELQQAALLLQAVNQEQAHLLESTAAGFESVRGKLASIAAVYPWAVSAAVTSPGLPRISIITPSYQKGRHIEETIRSVVDQGYPNFEHIIIDGGSTDGTIDILKKYSHIRWVSEPDRGQAHAINKGLLMASGDIVAYLNADDVYRQGAFSEVAEYFSSDPSARIVVGNCDYIDGNSNTIGHLRARYNCIEDLIRYWGWDRWYCIPQQSVFLRKELLSETGLFDPALHMVMDYDMWLRVAETTKIHILDRTLAAFRLEPDTKTGGSTHLMYCEEFQTSRRYWGRLPWRLRVRVAMDAHLHLSNRLLGMAEHFSLNSLQPATASQLVRGSVRHWPPFALSPRLLLTGAGLLTARTRAAQPVKRLHRAYLGLLWRFQNRRARGSSL